MIGQLTVRADVLHTLLMGSIAAHPSAISLAAIITGPSNGLLIAGTDAGFAWRRLDSVMLKRSILLKSSPQLARPDSMQFNTAARNESTASQSYFDVRRIKVIKCDIMRD